jgi:Arc/MetJ-type ribon-helix-helix transcriptional regulator
MKEKLPNRRKYYDINVNVHVSKEMIAAMEESWRKNGYPNMSVFIRAAVKKFMIEDVKFDG